LRSLIHARVLSTAAMTATKKYRRAVTARI
jgi:hypothetical protein